MSHDRDEFVFESIHLFEMSLLFFDSIDLAEIGHDPCGPAISDGCAREEHGDKITIFCFEESLVL
jgi:hypothetical protein